MNEKKKMVIKINKDFKTAYNKMENTGEHIFLTGNAGTGKSTLLQYFRKKTKKNIAVLAPTGVAALNVKGQTIHSFFGFAPGIVPAGVRRAHKDKKELIDNLDTIIIDEISMVRADLLDCVDKALRINRGTPHEAFGGVQMIFIGDLFQLPPVVSREEKFMFEEEYQSPYFFSAYVLGDFDLTFLELNKIYRQKDEKFIELLNKMRHKKLSNEDVDIFNSRYNPDFETDNKKEYIHLTTTNKMSDQRNLYELQKLDSEEETFKGTLDGKFDKNRTPAPLTLRLKVGARVMFTCNDQQKRWANGTLGTVTSISKLALAKTKTIRVKIDGGNEVVLSPHTWNMYEHFLDGDAVKMEQIGSYSQFPLVLAWAVTIHKSQGKTFENILVDMGWGAFAHGQMYVALSRCTTLNGIVLKQRFRLKDVIVDDCVIDFIGGMR